MPYYRLNLDCSRVAERRVVLVSLPPRAKIRKCHIPRKHKEQADSEKNEPVRFQPSVCSRLLLYFLCVHLILVPHGILMPPALWGLLLRVVCAPPGRDRVSLVWRRRACVVDVCSLYAAEVRFHWLVLDLASGRSGSQFFVIVYFIIVS